MKKNGFTLVEVLAVIAILAILVVISVPNILRIYNDLKKQSFVNETKNLYKSAVQEWMIESMDEKIARSYSKCDGCDGPELNTTGRKDIDYFVKIDSDGNVTDFYAIDGTYQSLVIKNFDDNIIKITDLNDALLIDELEDEDIYDIAEIEQEKEAVTTCLAGHYLSNGVCAPCPKNTYKDIVGNGACIACPEGTCTARLTFGATSASACSIRNCSYSPPIINPPGGDDLM